MKPVVSIAALLLLTGCISNPFFPEEPPVNTPQQYAEQICATAGADSEACERTRVQAMTRCYRTLGTVDCYTSEDPFGTNGSARSFVTPIDRRAPTPSPG